MRNLLPIMYKLSAFRRGLKNLKVSSLQSRLFSNTFHLRIITLIIFLLLLLLNLLVPSGVIFAQEEEVPRWSDPIPLSSKRPSSWFPDIAVDSKGGVHIVWSSKVELESQDEPERAVDSYDVVMYTYSPNGIDWEEPFDLIAIPATIEGVGGHEATRPSIIFDDEDKLHLVFRHLRVQYSQVSLEGIREAANWLEPRQISSPSGYYSDITIDRNNALHLVYTQNVPTADCPNCYHVLYRWSDDDGVSWSNVADVSLLPIGAVKPQILIDDRGYIHIVWEAGRGGGLGQLSNPTDVRYAASYDGGQNWSLPLQFVAPNGQAGNIAIGSDGEGNLIVVWFDVVGKNIYFQLSGDAGRSWSSPSAISDVYGFDARLDRYSMATDSNGVVHLVLVGKREEKQDSLELLHLTWDLTDAAWSVPEIITSLKGDVPEWPRIAISEDNSLHVVWFVRDKAHIWDSESGRYQVWYAQKSSSMLDSGPTAVPTPGPTTQLVATIPPTVEPTQLSLIQPDPTSTLITQIDTEGIANESDALSLVFKGLIPALIFVAVAVAIVRLRKV